MKVQQKSKSTLFTMLLPIAALCPNASYPPCSILGWYQALLLSLRPVLELAPDPGVLLRFPMELKALNADVIVIDTPPALTIELTLALYAADTVIVPVGLSRWTVAAYQVIADRVRITEKTTGRPVRLLALPDIVTEKETETLRKIPGWAMTRSVIFKSAAIRNATNTGKALKDTGKAWAWYVDLAREVME